MNSESGWKKALTNEKILGSGFGVKMTEWNDQNEFGIDVGSAANNVKKDPI